MYIETIFKTACPSCNSTNYVNAGDTDDMTGHDIDGIYCHACRHLYLLHSGGVGCEGGSNYEDGVATLS